MPNARSTEYGATQEGLERSGWLVGCVGDLVDLFVVVIIIIVHLFDSSPRYMLHNGDCLSANYSVFYVPGYGTPYSVCALVIITVSVPCTE